MAPGRCPRPGPAGFRGSMPCTWTARKTPLRANSARSSAGRVSPHLEGRGGVRRQHSRPAPLLLRAADHVEEAGLSGQPDGGLDVGDGALRMVLSTVQRSQLPPQLLGVRQLPPRRPGTRAALARSPSGAPPWLPTP